MDSREVGHRGVFGGTNKLGRKGFPVTRTKSDVADLLDVIRPGGDIDVIC